MKLSKALRSEFSSLVRNRGESYFWRGNVYIQSRNFKKRKLRYALQCNAPGTGEFLSQRFALS
jgi:hypothetical protein